MPGMPGGKGSVDPPGRKDSPRAAELVCGVELLLGGAACMGCKEREVVVSSLPGRVMSVELL